MPNVYDAKRMTLALSYAENATVTDSTILKKMRNAEVSTQMLATSFIAASGQYWRRSASSGGQFNMKRDIRSFVTKT